MAQPNQDYILHYDDKVEKVVVGALILESEAFFEVNSIISSDMFNDPVCRSVFKTIEVMHRDSIPVDMVTVTKEIMKVDKMVKPTDIFGLTESVGSAAHIRQHALYIKQEHIKRESLKVYQSSIKDIISGSDIDDVLSHSIRSLNIIDEGAVNNDSLRSIRDFAQTAIGEAAYRTSNYRNGISNGVPTFSEQLNRITGGWQKADLVIIAARPAMGKTAIALKILEMAAASKCNPGMWALEMKGERLIDRLILEKTGIQDWKYKQGKLSDTELLLVENTSNYLFSLNAHIDDCSSQTVSRIRSKARILKKKGLLGLVIVDYLQLTEGEGNVSTRNEEVSGITRELKKMAKDLDVPVIALSQLSRAVEMRGGDKRPQLSDLRDSGSIEQDADMVCFIHRPDYYGQTLYFNPEKTVSIPNGIEIIIAKYREGATGSVYLQHDGALRNIKDFNPLPF